MAGLFQGVVTENPKFVDDSEKYAKRAEEARDQALEASGNASDFSQVAKEAVRQAQHSAARSEEGEANALESEKNTKGYKELAEKSAEQAQKVLNTALDLNVKFEVDKSELEILKEVVIVKHGAVEVFHDATSRFYTEVVENTDAVKELSQKVASTAEVVKDQAITVNSQTQQAIQSIGIVTEIRSDVEKDKEVIDDLVKVGKVTSSKVESDRLEVSQMRNEINQEHTSVVQKHADVMSAQRDVTAMKSTVTSMRDEVSSVKDTVNNTSHLINQNITTSQGLISNANKTLTTAIEVQGRVEGMQGEVLDARDVAVSAINIVEVARDSAYTSSVSAKNSEDQSLIYYEKTSDIYHELLGGHVYRGLWNPNTGAYGNPKGTNSTWDVVLKPEQLESGCEFGGESWFFGDRVVYVLERNAYYRLPSGSTVTSVNGKKGAVNLTAGDVGAYEKSETYSKAEVNEKTTLKIADVREMPNTPAAAEGNKMSTWFTQDRTPGGWFSGITMKGWATGYAAWQLASYSGAGSVHNKLYFRTGLVDEWEQWQELYSTLNPPNKVDYSDSAPNAQLPLLWADADGNLGGGGQLVVIPSTGDIRANGYIRAQGGFYDRGAMVYSPYNKPDLDEIGAAAKTNPTFDGIFTLNAKDGAFAINSPADSAQYFAGTVGGARSWWFGKGSNINQDFTLRSDYHNTSLMLNEAGVNSSKDFYAYGNKVYHTGNLPKIQDMEGFNKIDSLNVTDIRGTNPSPRDFKERALTTWFNNTGIPVNQSWASGFTVKGWDSDMRSWQLCSNSTVGAADDSLFFRSGNNDEWGDYQKVYTDKHKPTAEELGAVSLEQVRATSLESPGQYLNAAGMDFNSLQVGFNGLVNITNTLNAPPPETWSGDFVHIEVQATYEIDAVQRTVPFREAKATAYRTCVRDSWGPWVVVYTDKHKPTPGDIGAYTKSEVDGLVAGSSSGGGAVSSVNGKIGDVVLSAGDVGALPLDGSVPMSGGLNINVDGRQIQVGANHYSAYLGNMKTGYFLYLHDDTSLRYDTNKIYHEGFKPTATEIGAVPTTGGNMSGELSFGDIHTIKGGPANSLNIEAGQFAFFTAGKGQPNSAVYLGSNAKYDGGWSKYNTQVQSCVMELNGSHDLVYYHSPAGNANPVANKHSIYTSMNKPTPQDIGAVSATSIITTDSGIVFMV